MKHIQEYLPFYLGCDIVTLTGKVEKLVIATKDDSKEVSLYLAILYNLKPILRPLSDMTQEENVNLHSILQAYPVDTSYDLLKRNASMTEYLLSKHLDLFGLIEAGLAIDKTKM